MLTHLTNAQDGDKAKARSDLRGLNATLQKLKDKYEKMATDPQYSVNLQEINKYNSKYL